ATRLGKTVRRVGALQVVQTAGRDGGAANPDGSLQPPLSVLQSVGRERLLLRRRASRSAHGQAGPHETDARTLTTRFANQCSRWRAVCLQTYRHTPRAAARTTV